MSPDTPRPERVSLSAEEAWGGAHWQLFRKHRPAGAYLPVGQLDGDCHSCGGPWPCRPVREALAERYVAREQALREGRDAAREALARVEALAQGLDAAVAATLTPLTETAEVVHEMLAAWRDDLRDALRGETR